MNRVHNLFRLIKLTIKAVHANHEWGTYHCYVRRTARKLMNKAREYNYDANGERLEERKFLKIQWYMVTTLFAGEIIALLMGKKLSKEEKMRYICLGSIFALSDILVDDYKFTAAKTKILLGLKDPKLASTSAEKIFLHYYIALFHYLPEDRINDIVELISKGGQSQLESIKQFDLELPKNDIERVVMEKGGTSFLLCRAMLSTMSKLEEAAFYQLGGLIQKLNDCVDMYKDGKEGVKSSANIFGNIDEIKNSLELQKEQTFNLLWKLLYNNKKKEDFIFIFHVFTVGVFFKLDEYSDKCGGVFDYQKFLKLSKKETRSQPFSIKSLRYCFWKILNYKYVPQ